LTDGQADRLTAEMSNAEPIRRKMPTGREGGARGSAMPGSKQRLCLLLRLKFYLKFIQKIQQIYTINN
jgi:hypothetical protein